ncbi:MAG: hypothetical protein ACOYKH_00810 [Brevefilum fermentans]|mgnify:FL=1|jgi:hypothetical protein|uniref:NERD domain-containing protein n=1 Tax=Candidatus Brevifilum fermentans TaxID=1986204 RepID=A0A1Y6K8J9_9CHLR|nr:hypothetical protein [Brevefilum fermentans]MDI9566145.1 hypothetical protein [Chloroflexota bacterium]SMX54330.1 conserved membrane protein of unknown function [Brevefilum fermentans]
MNKVINEKLIKRNKTIGNVLSISGFAILIGGLILNMNPTPTKTLVSFGALIVGFIVAQISTTYVTRFGRSPRFDEIIADNLSKLNNQYTFYVYNGPVPMLLVGPSGLWIPIPTIAAGEISYDNKWRQRGGSAFMKIFGQESIGKPELEIINQEKLIIDFLKKHVNEEQIPPTNFVLVSMNPKAVIGDVENAPVPIVDISSLRRFIRKNDRKEELKISETLIEKINETLSEF